MIDSEDPGPEGYKFKIHVFFNNGEEAINDFTELEKKIFFALVELNAEDIRIKTLPEKFRVFCKVKDKENAKGMYSLNQLLDNEMRCAIFLDFPEEIFVKYGDIEAEKFYK